MDNVVNLKKKAAYYAVGLIKSNMVVGLGHGTTAIHAIYKISEKIIAGELENIKGVPCSKEVEAEAKKLQIPLTTLHHNLVVDITIDGADEVDSNLELIKGGGGALLREKIIAQASKREVIVVDGSKLSPKLGTKWALPVEVLKFGWKTQISFLENLGAKVSLRLKPNNHPYNTDQKNYILDCDFGPIDNVYALSTSLNNRTGVVGHGLFLGLATDVIVADNRGIRHIQRTMETN